MESGFAVESGGLAPKALVTILEGLYQTERQRVFAICLARLGNGDDAEDAVQDTFARVAGRLCRADHANPPALLTAVAVNVCRDELRRRARRGPSAALEATVAAPGRALDDLVIDRETLRVLSAACRPASGRC